MPTYDYACTACGEFDALRPIVARNDPAPCPRCESPSARIHGSAPALACMDGNTRSAMDVNERARHEPRRSGDNAGSYGRMRHPSGCGCCSTPNRRSATARGANGSKAFPSKRPWMISH